MRRRKKEVCVLGEIEGGRREDGGQLKDHPMRGDLKPGLRFYEFGPGATCVHAHKDICAGPSDTGGEPQTKACLIQTAHVSFFKDPWAPLR